jgi:hypothetical protein
LANDCSLSDPWLGYATGNSAPVLVTEIFCDSRQERAVVESAARYGFADAALFPASSPQGRSRTGLLVVGAFVGGTRTRFPVTARDVAIRLHERWTEMLREGFFQSSELSPLVLRVLELELQG